MELWIKSQDKEILIPISDMLKVKQDKKTNGYFYKEFPTHSIWYKDIQLGDYETKERALEVLDEIVKYKDKLDKSYFLGMEESIFVSSIYEMPQE